MLTRRTLLKRASAAGLVGCGAAPAPSKLTSTQTGFSMPAEWAHHAGTIMQFPPAAHYCTGGQQDCSFIEQARAEWVAVAHAIARFEPVVMYVDPADRAVAAALLSADIPLVEAPLDDGWSRDTGPIFVRNEAELHRAVCFAFNGWGGSVDFAEDALVKWQMAADFGVETLDHPMVLEGGAVIQDGAGTLLTTEMCLLHETRNPSLSKADQEKILMDMLGARRVVWLDKGWVPDPLTNGHVDGIAAFFADGAVVLNSIDRSEDSRNYEILEDANARLVAAGLEVVRLPATSFTAFHINFYVVNGAVIVPIEGSAAVDDVPLGILADLHPDREIIGVEANNLGLAGGGIHCITQQVPEGIPWPF